MKFKLLPVVLILFFGVFVTSVLAESERSVAVKRNPGATSGLIATASATPKARGKYSLDEKRLKLCQTKENSVQKRLTQLTRLVVGMEGKFDTIALRVQNFYNTKVLTTGKVLSNYTEFTTDIANKKVLVDAALAKAQADSTAFSCTSDDPKGLLNQYRLDMQAVKKALHYYRTSIKNLIVAVHTLVGDTEEGKISESGSPVASGTPTATPTATPVPTLTPTPTATPII